MQVQMRISITKMQGEGISHPARPRIKAVRLTAATFDFPYVEQAFP